MFYRHATYKEFSYQTLILFFFCVGVMYSGEYDVCDVTLSVYPHRTSLKNMPGHGGNRTYDLWNTRPMLLLDAVNESVKDIINT
jgi:hypothetical protein